MKTNFIASTLAACVLAFGAASAMATPVVYNLNLTAPSVVGATEATVSMEQGINSVAFTITPIDGYAFANTGNHYAFAFELASAFSDAKVALTGATLANFTAATGTFNAQPFGNFSNVLDFIAKTNGLSGKYITPLTFTVSYASLSVDSFIRNGANGTSGVRFASDLGNFLSTSTGTIGSSENEGGGGGGTGNVPEPGSLALIGLGLLAAGALRRKA